MLAAIVGLGPATFALLRWTKRHPDRAGLVPFAGVGAGLLLLMLLVAIMKAGSPLSGGESGANFDPAETIQVLTPIPTPAGRNDDAGPEPAAPPPPQAVAPTAVPVNEHPATDQGETQDNPPGFDELVRVVWERVDRAVAEGVVDRPWVWGEEPLTAPMQEPYEDSPGGDRLVQYFDHARLEVTNPDKPSDSPWRLTSGLLVREMIKGRIQTGLTSSIEHEPADLDIVGEGDSPTVPNYSMLATLRDVEPLEPGEPIVQRLDGEGNITTQPVLEMRGIDVAVVDDVMDHAIARPFWEYMTATGPVWDGEEYQDGELFRDPYFATGHPVTEPYWIVRSDGETSRDVLVQCFERRCLIYGPDQGAEWRVTSSLVGRHYLAWRYGDEVEVASRP